MEEIIPRKKKGRISKKPNAKELGKLYSEMTQRELAEHYGVTIGTVARWLRECRQEEKNNGNQ